MTNTVNLMAAANMDLLIKLFMVVVACVGLFTLVVVIRDAILNERRRKEDERRKQLTQQTVSELVNQRLEELDKLRKEKGEDAAPKANPLFETVTEPQATKTPEPKTETTEVPENGVVFAVGTAGTLEEKYLGLSDEAKGYYDAIVRHAMKVENSRREKNSRCELYKVGSRKLVRLSVKRNVVCAEFEIPNPDFKNYLRENKIKVQQQTTVIRVVDDVTLKAATDTVDLIVRILAEEEEAKKQAAKERRQAKRAANKAQAQ